MDTEYEIKILDIDVDEVKKKLESLGAKLYLERSMRRYVYDFHPKKKDCWIRLRDNGERKTLTIKEIQKDTIDGTKEIEVTVDDFEKTNLLLNKLGYFHKAYQKNRRISYRLDNVKIEIDSWPKIPPYLEIEADSEEEVYKVVALLGFKKSQTTSIGVKKVFTHYGIDIDSFKELTF